MFFTTTKLKELILECRKEYSRFSSPSVIDKQLRFEFDFEQKKEIIQLIKKDIEYGESQLTGTFQENKPWNWRITGMKDLIERIEGTGIYKEKVRKPRLPSTRRKKK